MPTSQPQMLDALKIELQFLENGGYEPSVRRQPAEAIRIFLDSPLCLNVLPEKGVYPAECGLFPCSKCWLINFVPAGQRFDAVPCHHIPLNERGDTVTSMAKSGGDLRVQDAVRDWLRAKSREFDAVSAPSQAPSPMARSQSA